MSIDRGSHDRAGHDDAPPLDPHRPYVDGSAAPPAELRAEVGRLSDEHVERVEVAREELAATLTELTARLDPRPRVQELGARVVALLQRPAVLGPIAALAGLVVLRRVRRARTSDREG